MPEQPASPPTVAKIKRLALVPVGRLDAEVLPRLRLSLEKSLSVDCAIADYIPRPLTAYDQGRSQFLAAAVLARVAEEREDPSTALLGVIDADIYTAPFRFTFGEVDRPAGTALLSVRRLRPDFYGEDAGMDRLYQRALSEALYQVGRLLGLAACEERACAMFPANGVGDVDRKQAALGDCCARLLDSRITS